MHACGHDFHVSMMLGNAEMLSEMRDEFCGRVKIIFQHSEDTQPGGAKELVAKGVMEECGCHSWATRNYQTKP